MAGQMKKAMAGQKESHGWPSEESHGWPNDEKIKLQFVFLLSKKKAREKLDNCLLTSYYRDIKNLDTTYVWFPY